MNLTELFQELFVGFVGIGRSRKQGHGPPQGGASYNYQCPSAPPETSCHLHGPFYHIYTIPGYFMSPYMFLFNSCDSFFFFSNIWQLNVYLLIRFFFFFCNFRLYNEKQFSFILYILLSSILGYNLFMGKMVKFL